MTVILDARVLSGSGGGPDKTLINSPRFLAPAGYRMLCAYLHDPADPGFESLRLRAAAKQAELVSVPDRGPLDWRVVPRMLEVCRRERVAVWHGHDYKSNALGIVLNRFWPMRLVTTLHGWVHRTARTPLYYLIDRASLRFYEHVFCVSDDLYSVCRKSAVPPHRCELLENGIDLQDFRRTKTVADAKKALGLDAGRFLVGAAGRLSAEKGFDILIRAAADLRRRGVGVDVVIAGEGVEKANLEALIRELGVGESVRLLGFRADLRELFEAMDLYALPSHREGLPNVLLEALAMEVPIVSTAVNGIPRLLTHEQNALLVQAGSVEAFSRSIEKMLADEKFREQFARAGRQTVEERFSFAARMDKLRRLYDRLLARAGPGQRKFA